ncbi:MAG: preprotein translocase subunit SecE [bacterium]|nr:preprotein translocase subunit SecE [bacterium]
MSKNPIQWTEDGRQFLSEVQVEVKKVTWPTQKETLAGTVSVVVLVLLVGAILFGFDSAISGMMQLLWP